MLLLQYGKERWMMKRNKNKSSIYSLLPIPFFFGVVALSVLEGFIRDRLSENMTNIVMIILLFVLVGGFIVTIVIMLSKEDITNSKNFNAKRVKNLEDDIYGHYSKLTNQFTYTFNPNEDGSFYYGMWMNEHDRYRLEHFIVTIVKHPKFLQLYKHRFETLNHSDGSYFQLMHIYALYYLLENDITKFQIHYRQFKDTIHLRTESRVLGEKFHRIKFNRDHYDIPVDLIELMYEYHVLDKAIDREIMRFKPKCKLDEMIYMTILYHYLVETENKKMLSDIEEEYYKYQEIRKNL